MGMSAEEEDLVYFCRLYYMEHRDREAVSSLRELIAANPVFDWDRGCLFQAVHKMVIDSLRDTINVLSQYYEIELDHGHASKVSLLAGKKEELCRQLIQQSREAIETIDRDLLPNAADAHMTVFFHKLRGDLYRYVAECSDDTESVAAANDAEASYTQAFQVADVNLATCHPIRMGLVLNAAVFKYQIRKDLESATDMLVAAEKDIDASTDQFSENSTQQLRDISLIIRQNLEAWAEEVE
jgi:14-3-3 protein epsilon